MGQKQRLFGILILLVVLALSYFIVWGNISDAYNNFFALRKAQDEEKALKELIQNKLAISRKYQEFRAQNASLFKALPDSFSESDIIVGLDTLAKNAGLQLTAIDTKKAEDTGIISIQPTLVGSLDSLREFLRNTEKSYPLIEFGNTHFSSDLNNQNLILNLEAHLLLTPPNPSLSYQELKAKIDESLKMKIEALNDPRMRNFKPAGQIPVLPPSKDAVGGHNPFAPL